MRCECGEVLFLGKCEACGREAVPVAAPKLWDFTRVITIEPLDDQVDASAHPGPYTNFGCVIPNLDQVDESGPAAGETSPPLPAIAAEIAPIRAADGLTPKAAELLDLAVAHQRIADIEAQLAQLEDENLALRTALSENGGWEERARAAIARAEAAEDRLARATRLTQTLRWISRYYPEVAKRARVDEALAGTSSPNPTEPMPMTQWWWTQLGAPVLAGEVHS